jgi:hypothetical protein
MQPEVQKICVFAMSRTLQSCCSGRTNGSADLSITSWWMFAAGISLACMITILTNGSQTIHVAGANPVKVLRSDNIIGAWLIE